MKLVAISFLAFLLTALAQQCAPSIPFSKQLVGKSFRWMNDCYKPYYTHSVAVYAKMTIVKIREGSRFFNCPETYLIRYRKPALTPMIIKYPALDFETPNSWSTDENNKLCNENQERVKIEMFPVEETRGNFTEAVKRMMPYLREIRDYACEVDEDGMWTEVKGRAYVNVDVQQVMTYLDTIAFKYSLCI